MCGIAGFNKDKALVERMSRHPLRTGNIRAAFVEGEKTNKNFQKKQPIPILNVLI